MIVSLSEIMSVKNKAEHIEAPLELRCFKLDGMEYAFSEKNNVVLDFDSNGGHKVSFTAKTTLSLVIPCSRCLEDVIISFDVQVSKDLDFNDTDNDRIKDLDELNYIDGYNLDVDVLVFDEILLRFPLQVLCKPDCKGICKVCGKNLNKQSCDCNQLVSDPRMSVIQDIFKNYKEV
ncbi:MAG: DUF177 domain-containing protein [Velocimicrobium sp.]